MSTERRYGDDEVREIFRRASSDEGERASAPVEARGLTLAELQEIGQAVDLPATAIARAAASLDAPVVDDAPPVPARRYSVAAVAPLPRAPTEVEWERLVAELRSTFRARGRLTSQGNLREWWNGNLHACIEPAETGYRLRMGSVNSRAQAFAGIGAMAIMASMVGVLSEVFVGRFDSLVAPIVVGLAGVGTLIANSVRARRWAAEREQQMRSIAARFRTIMGVDPPPLEERTSPELG